MDSIYGPKDASYCISCGCDSCTTNRNLDSEEGKDKVFCWNHHGSFDEICPNCEKET